MTDQGEITRKAERKFSLWRFLKRLFLWSAAVFLFILLSGIVLLKIYEDDIKAYAVGILNENLASPVYVAPENIDVTFLASFPSAAVVFKDMSALDAWDKKKKDTLFHAGKISLLFNIMDVLGGNYNFKKLEIEELRLNMISDREGKNNYSIFKKDSVSPDTASFSLRLEKIFLSDSRITYEDRKEKLLFDAEISRAVFEGNFSDVKYELTAEADLLVKEHRTDSTRWIQDKDLKLSALMDAEKDVYRIRSAQLELAGLSFSVNGEFSLADKQNTLELKVKGDHIGIASALSLLPEEYRKDAERYESDGDLFFEADINGDASDPAVSAQFRISGGTLSEKSSSVSLGDIQLEGRYEGSDLYNKEKVLVRKSHLTVKTFSAEIEGGKINGKFSVNDLRKPKLSLSLEGSMSLEDLNGFLKIDTLSGIEGSVKMNVNYTGPLKSGGDISVMDLESISASGSVNISDCSLKLKNSAMEFSGVNGTFELQNSDVEVKEFRGKALSTDFLMKGYFRDAAKYLLDDKYDMRIEASFVSEFVDLNELLANNNTETKSDTAYSLAFPDRIDLKLQTKVEKTAFRNFEAGKIRGELIMRDQKLIMDPVTFNTMDGSVSAMLMVDADRESDILITCDADLKSINVNKLFTQMENFGQDYLVDRHLRGTANADLQFASVWNKDLSVDPDKIYARSSITIERGELISFEPLVEIADDMKKDIIMRELVEVDEFRKKMEHVKFTTLQNEVEIRKQVISIPKMDVKTSAMNITFFGTHNFRNEIDYHFSFLLSDILTKGKKKRIERNKEFGVEEDDGTGKVLYYTMTGTVDDFEFKKDYKSKKEQRREEVRKEKETLKDILREEFGWFKKDTAQKKKDDPKKPDKFILKWEDEKKKEDEAPGDEDY